MNWLKNIVTLFKARVVPLLIVRHVFAIKVTLCLALVLLISGGWSESSYAAAEVAPLGTSTSMAIPIGTSMAFCTIKPSEAAGNVARCLTSVLNIASRELLRRFIQGTRQIVRAALTLAIILYGIRVIFGAGYNVIGPETFMFIIKFTVVVGLLSNGDYLAQWTWVIMQGSQQLGAIMLSGVESAAAVWTCPADTVFGKVDCEMFRIFGIAWEPSGAGLGGEYVLKDGTMIGLILVGAIISGPAGALVFTLFIASTIALLIVMVQALLMYVAALFIIAILMAMAPIMIPLILFGQTTTGMFKLWVNSIIVYSIQPLIVITYVSMTLVMMHLIAQQMTAIYDQAKARSELVTEKTKFPLISMPKTSIKEEELDPTGELRLKLQADVDAYGAAVSAPKDSFLGGLWESASGLVSKAKDFMTDPLGSILSNIELDITVPYLELRGPDVVRLATLFGLQFIMAWIMQSFGRQVVAMSRGLSSVASTPDLMEGMPGQTANTASLERMRGMDVNPFSASRWS